MKTARYIGKCKACNCVTSALVVGQDMNRSKDDSRREGADGSVYSHSALGHAVDCRSCGKAVRATPVKGIYSAKHVCSAKCLSSTGHNCECSCGGKNHGASHAA